MSPLIEAAGGLVWREVEGRVEVAVVHRARYDDWSLPKGTALDGESALRTAVREVGEETGADVQVSRWLGKVRYRVNGTDKVVRFWAMRAHGGTFQASDEVDAIEWLDAAPARERLGYHGDRAMLERFLMRPVPTSVLIVIRHAKAGKRSEWSGTDDLRPLERAGRAQARGIAALVSVFAPHRVLSARPVRCAQTVTPLATQLGLDVEVDGVYGDASSTIDPQATCAAFLELAKSDTATAVCSQGTTITTLISALDPEVIRRDSTTAKGASWVLGCRDGQVISADYYGAASLAHSPSGKRAGRHRG